jgi:hypothetical protein
MREVIKILLFLFACSSLACDYPDEGNMPLRRAVMRVQMLPEIDAWASAVHRTGVVTQYAVLLDQPVRHDGRCYWTVEVRAEGKLWRSFIVTPDGRSILPLEPR